MSTTGGGPTITYRITNPTGPLATLTTNGAVYIIPAGPSIDLAPSLVVDISIPVGMAAHSTEAEAAIAAYRGYVDVLDRAMQEPTQDWSADFAKYLMDPLYSGAVKGVADIAKKNLYTTGHVAYRGAAKSAAANEVQLRLCNDVRGRDWIDVTSGISTKTDQGGGRIQEITVTRAKDGRWLVSAIYTEMESRC